MLPERKLNRLKNFDYRTQALYFVTSCIQNKEHWFGEVIDGEMHLNEFGRIAEEQFNWLTSHYTFIVLHAQVVMPNHIHAIIEIEGNGMNLQRLSLSQIMAAYKTLTSRKIRLAGLPEFAWQRSFHDHIIRHDRAYFNILNYIENNPTNWQQDKFNT